MYEHKMYQKVTSVPQCLGEGGTGAKPTLAQLALGQVAGLPGFHLVSFDQWCPSVHYTSYRACYNVVWASPQLGVGRGCELPASGPESTGENSS